MLLYLYRRTRTGVFGDNLLGIIDGIQVGSVKLYAEVGSRLLRYSVSVFRLV